MARFLCPIPRFTVTAANPQSLFAATAGANFGFKIIDWMLCWHGINAVQAPISCQVGHCSADGTGTADVPTRMDGGGAAAGNIFTYIKEHSVDVTFSTNEPGMVWAMHPQTSIFGQLAMAGPIVVPISGIWGIHVLDPVTTTDVTGYVIIEE